MAANTKNTRNNYYHRTRGYLHYDLIFFIFCLLLGIGTEILGFWQKKAIQYLVVLAILSFLYALLIYGSE